MAEDSLAILPNSMGKPGAKAKAKPDASKFIPEQRGGLLLTNPNEEESPYTFSDSPAYLREKEAQEQAKRALELESKEETRGFLRSVEELAKKQKWEEAFHILERRTAVPSGLFLVTRAMLRWRFNKYRGALRDAEEALKNYGSSAKAGPLAAAFASFARICLGSRVSDRGSCSKEMKELVLNWEQSEEKMQQTCALGLGLFHPRQEERLSEPSEVVENMEAQDFSYVAATGLRIGYVLLKNKKDPSAPFVIHFHGSAETAADYRGSALAEKYRDLSVHLLVVDYRGYGWSGDQPSLATFLRDAEPLAEKLPEIFIQNGFSWPYPSGLILSGRSIGAQVAVHLAVLFPELFRAVMLDSALATSATGDRLGRAPERAAALECWRKELEKANLEILHPLDQDLYCLSALEKIRAYDGQLLVMHGLADETVPYEGSESLHAAAGTRNKEKELVLIEGAGHNNIGHFDAYWTAMRRFALKVQLDSSLPSSGPGLDHLCAVCAEKAVSKCGRCMKVWYCGRQHQAEHWKSHKVTCAGGPPEPKVKVEPEGEACVVAVVALEITGDEDVVAFKNCLVSIGAQEEPLHSLYVSWHAESKEHQQQVAQALKDFETESKQVKVVAIEAPNMLYEFEHIKTITDVLAKEVPTHAWIAFINHNGLWSNRYLAVLLPSLRRAAADPRVIAVNCPRFARLKDASTLPEDESRVTVALTNATNVGEALGSGRAELITEAVEPQVADISVRVKMLKSFLETTPAPALSHKYCGHRFHYKLSNTFGKKMQTFNPPTDEWMRWAPLASTSATNNDSLTQDDWARGKELFTGTAKARVPKAAEDEVANVDATTTGESATNVDATASESATNVDATTDGESSTQVDATTNSESATHVENQWFTSAPQAAQAIARLRQSIERRMIEQAGGTMTAKDLRSMTTTEMTIFLEHTGLNEVIGIQRWARDTSSNLFEEAARGFHVEITKV